MDPMFELVSEALFETVAVLEGQGLDGTVITHGILSAAFGLIVKNHGLEHLQCISEVLLDELEMMQTPQMQRALGTGL